MERLYTSITNKEQNNNYLQTGRTGEREDFMRENLFMTETFEAHFAVKFRRMILLMLSVENSPM